MVEPHPIQAIRDAIAHLEAEIEPVRAQIEHIRRDADEQVATLRLQIADRNLELNRWRTALDQVEGRLPDRPARRAHAPALHISDHQLLQTLRAAEGPMAVGQLRDALAISPDVLRSQLTRVLSDAVRRGVINRTGQRRATKYSAP